MRSMIVLFTDFGLVDPYVGQVHAVFARDVPDVPIINLLHAVPNFDIRAGAYLLPSYVNEFPVGTVFMCVVDPGVGGARVPMILKADGRWFVGPDNGLFSVLARRASKVKSWVIRWQPPRLSHSFHGRDLFAPVAVKLALGRMPASEPAPLLSPRWPADLPQVIYIDHYGNGVTGLREGSLATDRRLRVGRHLLQNARVFGEVPPGRAFWYINANGLVEIAVREGNAARRLRLRLGTRVQPVR
jgi:S-adenosylmethionine hydrolase